MKNNKIVEMLMGLLTKLNIKNKKLKWAVAIVLGILIAVSTQLTGVDSNSTDKVVPDNTNVSNVVQDGVEGFVGNVLNKLF